MPVPVVPVHAVRGRLEEYWEALRVCPCVERVQQGAPQAAARSARVGRQRDELQVAGDAVRLRTMGARAARRGGRRRDGGSGATASPMSLVLAPKKEM